MKIASLAGGSWVESVRNQGHVVRECQWDDCDIAVITDGSMVNTATINFMQWAQKRSKPLYYTLTLRGVEYGTPTDFTTQATPAALVGKIEEEVAIKPTTAPIGSPVVLFVARQIRDGDGGAEKSIKAITAKVNKLGYAALACDYVTFNNWLEKDLINPQLIVAQSLVARDVFDIATLRLPSAIKAEYVQCLSQFTPGSGADEIIVNSNYTAGKLLSDHSVEHDYIQVPVLSASYSRATERTGAYVLCPDIRPLKGGALFAEMAEALDPIPFLGLDPSLQGTRAVTGNKVVLGFQGDMRAIYGGARVVIVPSHQPETWCRSAHEAIANGIPLVVSTNGNLATLPLDYPKNATAVHQDDKAGWAKAIAKGWRSYDKCKTVPSFWDDNIDGIAKLLKDRAICKNIYKPPLVLRAAGGSGLGIGDAWMIVPTLKELSKKFKINVPASTFNGTPMGLAVLERYKFINTGEAPKDCIPYELKNVNYNEPVMLLQQEPRHLSFARRACVEPEQWIYDFKLSKRTTAAAKKLLPKTKRKLIGVSFIATHKERSMDRHHAISIIDELREKYHVCVFHKEKFYEAANVTDMGGLLDTDMFIHAVPLLDGVIAVDSGLAHTASVFGVPTVVIMGPVGRNKSIQYTRFYGEHVTELCLDLPCQPCYYTGGEGCQEGPKCFDIPVVTTRQALEKLL